MLDRDSIPALAGNDFVYLNSGGSGPPPDYVRRAMSETEDLTSGAAYLEGSGFYARCAESTTRARETTARMLGANPEDLAITQNTSNGMSLGMAGLDFSEGDEVVTTTTEHPGCLVPLHALRSRYGVKVKLLSPPITPQKIGAALNGRTRLVALSHVDWTTGAVVPLEEISPLVREHGALTLVDGAQSVGDMEVDLPATGVDLYAFTAHKWLLGPEGIGGLYVRPGCQVASTNLGFASVADPRSFDIEGGYALKAGAGRFEGSTMSPTLTAGLAAASEATAERGVRGFGEIQRKADLLMGLLSEDPRVTIHTPRPARNGLVAFEVEGVDSQEAVGRLLERRFVVRFLPKPTYYIRASTHLFVTDEEIQALVREIRGL